MAAPPSAPSTYCERPAFSPAELASIESALRRRLGPDFVSTRPSGSGGQVAYIEGWKAVQLANDIFGFNNWSRKYLLSCDCTICMLMRLLPS